jgi:hypothetical protein
MRLGRITVSITTDGSGDATDYTAGKVTGRIHAIIFAFGDLDAGTDFVITGNTTGTPILTKANVGAANAVWYPRVAMSKVADGAALSFYETVAIHDEKIKIVTDEGAATKTGTLTFLIES